MGKIRERSSWFSARRRRISCDRYGSGPLPSRDDTCLRSNWDSLVRQVHSQGPLC